MEKRTLITHCCMCQKHQAIEVLEDDFKKYKAGAKVQDAFPYLSANEREMLISGTCGACWDSMFAADN